MKKCDTCLHHSKYATRGAVIELCSAPATQVDNRIPTQLGDARVICNKEGDGIFVYFQPKSATGKLVQIGRAAA
jgi:hypothetical protein